MKDGIANRNEHAKTLGVLRPKAPPAPPRNDKIARLKAALRLPETATLDQLQEEIRGVLYD